MQLTLLFSKWTNVAGLLLIGGALAWAIKLGVIISTNGRIIDTGAAALFMKLGIVQLLVGSTGIGNRIGRHSATWVRTLAILLSPVVVFGTLLLFGMTVGPLFQNSSVWCVHCHSPVNNVDSLLKKGEEPSLAGTKKFETPFGTFFTPNITPDIKTGIGKMSDAEIARVLRYGVKSNGEAVLPFMQGQDMSDEDMTALISYLRSVKPSENKVPESQFSLMGRLAKAFVVKPSIPESAVTIARK